MRPFSYSGSDASHNRQHWTGILFTHQRGKLPYCCRPCWLIAKEAVSLWRRVSAAAQKRIPTPAFTTRRLA